MLYVVAFPEMSDQDAARLSGWQRRFDPTMAAQIAPHFTLVFGTEAMPQRDFQDHVAQIAKDTRPFAVEIRATMLWPDGAGFLLFAVPDQGNAAILSLHDALYRGPLAAELRCDLPFVPHMTLGRFTDPGDAMAARDTVNANLPPTPARVGAITVTRHIAPIATLPLGTAA